MPPKKKQAAPSAPARRSSRVAGNEAAAEAKMDAAALAATKDWFGLPENAVRSVLEAYTVMGDPVNTAARMLDTAGDREVVAESEVLEHTRALYTTDRLAAFHSVENTYISIFNVLGGLGVILGAAGLGLRPSCQPQLDGSSSTVGSRVTKVTGTSRPEPEPVTIGEGWWSPRKTSTRSSSP